MWEKIKSFGIRYGSAFVLGALLGHFDSALLKAGLTLLKNYIGG